MYMQEKVLGLCSVFVFLWWSGSSLVVIQSSQKTKSENKLWSQKVRSDSCVWTGDQVGLLIHIIKNKATSVLIPIRDVTVLSKASFL